MASAAEAVADIADGSSLAVGGFGMSGVPTVLIAALLEQGATDLEVISNNLGVDGFGLGTLLVGRADPAHDRLLRRQQQGVRPPVPGR